MIKTGLRNSSFFFSSIDLPPLFDQARPISQQFTETLPPSFFFFNHPLHTLFPL